MTRQNSFIGYRRKNDTFLGGNIKPREGRDIFLTVVWYGVLSRLTEGKSFSTALALFLSPWSFLGIYPRNYGSGLKQSYKNNDGYFKILFATWLILSRGKISTRENKCQDLILQFQNNFGFLLSWQAKTGFTQNQEWSKYSQSRLSEPHATLNI